MTDPRSWSPERKTAAALGLLALVVAAATPLLFRNDQPLEIDAVSVGAGGEEKVKVFRSRSGAAPAAVKAGGSFPEEAAAVPGSGEASAASAGASPARLRIPDRSGRRTGGGGAGGGAGPDPATLQEAAAHGIADVPPSATDPAADAARDWGRIKLEPFSQQNKVTLESGRSSVAGGPAGLTPDVRPDGKFLEGEPDGVPGAAAPGRAGAGAGKGSSPDAAVAGAGAGTTAGAPIDVSAAEAALADGRETMRKGERCTEASRAHQSELKTLTKDLNWSIEERVRERCPVRGCGEMSSFCERRNSQGVLWRFHKWACYCDRLTCITQKACRGINESNCRQKRACEDPPVTCTPSKCG